MKRKRIAVIGLGIAVLLILFFVVRNQQQAADAAAAERSSAKSQSIARSAKSSQKSAKASQSAKELRQSKKASRSIPIAKKKKKAAKQESTTTPSVSTDESKDEKVFDQAITLDNHSDQNLTQVISQQMANIAPSTHGPARWTVYVEELGGQQRMASLANWQPAHSQYSASTIKLFILIRYYQLVHDGQLNPNDSYQLRQSDVVQGSGIMLNDPIGTQYTLQRLCELMITKSDNIATNVLIDRVGGFDAVNRTIAKVVGPNHYSSLERKMMDTSNITNGRANRINAKEATQTLLKIKQGQIVSAQADQEMLSLMLQTKNRTKLPSLLPAGAICYNKSGESGYRGIENDMAIIEYNGHVFAMCALIEMDGNNDEPLDATPLETESEINTIAALGQAVTNAIAVN